MAEEKPSLHIDTDWKKRRRKRSAVWPGAGEETGGSARPRPAAGPGRCAAGAGPHARAAAGFVEYAGAVADHADAVLPGRPRS